MSSLLEQVGKDLRALSREEQDRAARLLLTLLDGPQDDVRLMA
jgi:cbb3-type cytochrome oxidase subunit 3